MTSAQTPRFALFNLGFRPLYLLAALWLVVAVPLWLLSLRAGWSAQGHLQGAAWHAHEMIFGFACAVIVGFLFTAVRNWTGRDTPQGLFLFIIAMLWVLARVSLMTPWSQYAPMFEAGFFSLAILGIARPLVASGNKRNFAFIGLLSILGGLAFLHQAAALAWVEFSAYRIAQLALVAIAIIITIIAGRIIPMFTRNAVPHSKPRSLPWLDAAAVISLVLAAAAYALSDDHWALGVIAAAALIHLYRWWLWHPLSTLDRPILWILHLSYLGLPSGLALLAVPRQWLASADSLGMHAFTVGAICGLCMAMMSRTARGHTGRPLEAGDLEVWAYMLVLAAAMLRVLLTLINPDRYLLWLELSGALLSIAFLLYLIRFVPWLIAPRADGKPG